MGQQGKLTPHSDKHGKAMSIYDLAWWNLENLFDVENSPDRSDKLQRAIGRELEGWDTDVLERKLQQLGRVIRQMNDGRGPDLLGVCEVENKHVLECLVDVLAPLGRNYAIVHANTLDR